MKAILSDIHGNLEALTAVLDDIVRRQVDVVYNLGNMTGYGPNPIECIERSMDMDVVLLGVFDDAVLTGATGFESYLEQSVRWTQMQLESVAASTATSQHPRDFLAGLPRSHRDDDVLFVHGSPADPASECLMPDSVYNRTKMRRIGRHIERVCFNGHSHVPGIFVENSRAEWEFITPAECDGVFKLDGRKTICNAGSVGQPRDRDWRAGYVLFDGMSIQFHRVEYEVEATMKKIKDLGEPELAHISADRLREGI